MKLAAFATTALIALSATAASADQLAKAAGVAPGVYSDNTLAALITAKEDGNATLVAYLLDRTNDNVRVSTRGTAIDFDRLIDQAKQDGDSGKVASLQSLQNGDNYTGGIDYARLIADAEAEGDSGKAAALKSRAGL
ncbi:hypothetical protein [Nereida sp. MMG025]|uniref:hypothetical protein n=1 Tax=Nereida sp. MMG025 TaxID=2909981 RepID=UPI001F21781E|nr:hypothetical protein [Nereida sp. MMG025]MCF6443558.1 hypothetical protein [Nereida sp. MMG025]